MIYLCRSNYQQQRLRVSQEAQPRPYTLAGLLNYSLHVSERRDHWSHLHLLSWLFVKVETGYAVENPLIQG